VTKRLAAPTLAKLAAPSLARPLPRQRLFELLDEACAHSVIWISGPPGAGKTTLIASYLEVRRRPATWYRVDVGDNDVATFFHYMGLAHPTRGRAKVRSMPVFGAEYADQPLAFARRYFRDFYSRLPYGAAIVLDDLHAADNSQFLNVIRIMFDELPPRSNCFVTSRAEPPPELIEKEAKGGLAFVNQSSLRFDLHETRALVSQKTKVDIDLQGIHALTEGWAAGLVLACERALRAEGRTEQADSDTQEAVFNYFAGPILDEISAEHRSVLLLTALLPTMTARMAEELSNNPAAGKILESLYRRHLFIERHVASEVSFRYHTLFRQFLKSRAKELIRTETYAQAQRCAAQLLEARGSIEDALDLYREAEDWTASARLICRTAATLLAQGRSQALRGWIDALPTDVVEKSPWLRFWMGNVLLEVDQPHAARWLEPAFSAFVAAGDVHGQMLCAAMIVESEYNEMGDYQALDPWLAILERALAATPAFASPEESARVYAATLIGLTIRQPDNPMLPALASRLRALVTDDLELTQRVAAGGLLLTYLLVVRDDPAAATLVAMLHPLQDDARLPPRRRILWLISYATWHSHNGHHPEATAALVQAEAISDENGFGHTLSHMVLLLNRFRNALLQRDLATAKGFLNRAEVSVRHPSQLARFYLAYYKAQLALLQGRLDDAVVAGRTSVALAQRVGVPRIQLPGMLEVIASAFVKQGRLDDALTELRTAHSACTVAQAATYGATMQVVETLIALRGDHADAYDKLGQTLGLLLTQRNFALLPYVPELLAELAATALRLDVCVDYARELIERRQLPAPSPDVEKWPWPVKVFTLGRFGIELNGQSLSFGAKAPRKPLQLLKALAAAPGLELGNQQLIDWLWPEPEREAVKGSFDMAIHRLRKLLGDDVIQLKEGHVALNRDRVWVDAAAFYTLATAAERDAGNVLSRDAAARRALDLYQGTFLGQEPSQQWTVMTRERLRAKFLRLVLDAGSRHEQQRAWDTAIELYERGIEQDILAEELYRGLIRCHVAREEPAAALRAFRRCKEILSTVLGVNPTTQTVDLIAQLYERQGGGPPLSRR
jgi:LuxR family maltose regulon positive regulatory protein